MRHLSTDLCRRRRPITTTTTNTSTSPSPYQHTQTYKHPHLPPLFYAVMSRDWTLVLRRVRTHPHETTAQESVSRSTPLHYACRYNPPPDVVKALSIGGAKRMVDMDGATPLHIAACSRCGVVAVGVLVREEEEEEEEREEKGKEEETTPLPLLLTKIGRAPLHYACLSFRGLGLNAFRVLLDATIEACVKLEQRRRRRSRRECISSSTLVGDVSSSLVAVTAWEDGRSGEEGLGMDLETEEEEEEEEEFQQAESTQECKEEEVEEEEETRSFQLSSSSQHGRSGALDTDLDVEEEEEQFQECKEEVKEEEETKPSKLSSSSNLDEHIDDDGATHSYDLEWDDVTDVAHRQADAFTMQDYSGQTPLSLLFRRYRQRVRDVIRSLEQPPQQEEDGGANTNGDVDHHQDEDDNDNDIDGRRQRRNRTAAAAAQVRPVWTLINGRIVRRDAVDRLVNPPPPAAAAVRDELGELWQKARLMVCLLAEQRLERERDFENDHDHNDEEEDVEGEYGEEEKEHDEVGVKKNEEEEDKKNSEYDDYHNTKEEKDRARSLKAMQRTSAIAAAAVANEAAKWARQQYQRRFYDDEEWDDEDLFGDGDGGGGSSSETNNVGNGEDGTTWNGIGASTGGSSGTGRKFRLVHASVGLIGYGCPPEMIRLAASVYPHQVREMDEDGNLPLHIAAVASSFLPTASPLPPNDDGDDDEYSLLSSIGGTNTTSYGSGGNGGGGSSVISHISGLTTVPGGGPDPHPFHRVIQTLLRIYPTAARIPHGRSGKLPLTLAVESKKRTMEDGIRVLLESYPAALDCMDINVGLYPWVLAAVGRRRTVEEEGGGSGGKGKPRNGRRGGVCVGSNGRRSRKVTATTELRCVPNVLFETLQAKPGLLLMGLGNGEGAGGAVASKKAVVQKGAVDQELYEGAFD